MARNNRRQFVWARSAGATGPGLTPAVFGVDLLVGTRERYGDAVLRGATVMGVKGYIRPNVPSDTINYISCRAAIRVGTAGEVDDEPVNVRELGPWFSPEDDWMLFQQSLFITSASAAEGALPAEPATDNVRGNMWAVETRANRKFEELGRTLLLFTDMANPVGTPWNEGFFDYDLSIGLKLP